MVFMDEQAMVRWRNLVGTDPLVLRHVISRWEQSEQGPQIRTGKGGRNVHKGVLLRCSAYLDIAAQRRWAANDLLAAIQPVSVAPRHPPRSSSPPRRVGRSLPRNRGGHWFQTCVRNRHRRA